MEFFSKRLTEYSTRDCTIRYIYDLRIVPKKMHPVPLAGAKLVRKAGCSYLISDSVPTYLTLTPQAGTQAFNRNNATLVLVLVLGARDRIGILIPCLHAACWGF